MKTPILYLGNILTAYGINPTSVETLGVRLKDDFIVFRASDKRIYLHRLWDMLLTLFRLRNRVKYVLIDTYSTTAFYFAFCCGFFSKILGLPFIPILRGGELPDRFKSSPRLSNLLLKNAFRRVSPSMYLEDSAYQLTGVQGEVIPNYIDIEKYQFLARKTASPLQILWVRAFDKIYDPQLAIEIVYLLQKKGLDAKLTMIGGDKDGSFDECKNLISARNLQNQVNLLGKLPKSEWIAISEDYNLFLNTTTADNTPVSVMEAMALGMPVLTSKVGGIPYLFEDRKEGIMVEERTAEGFVRSIEELLSDSVLVENISKNARLKAENWDWQVVRKLWLQLLATK